MEIKEIVDAVLQASWEHVALVFTGPITCVMLYLQAKGSLNSAKAAYRQAEVAFNAAEDARNAEMRAVEQIVPGKARERSYELIKRILKLSNRALREAEELVDHGAGYDKVEMIKKTTPLLRHVGILDECVREPHTPKALREYGKETVTAYTGLVLSLNADREQCGECAAGVGRGQRQKCADCAELNRTAQLAKRQNDEFEKVSAATTLVVDWCEDHIGRLTQPEVGSARAQQATPASGHGRARARVSQAEA